MDTNPVLSAIGAQKALLGEMCPGAAPKKTPRSFRGNKGSGWRQPQLLCFSLTPGTIKRSPHGKVSNIHIQFLLFLMGLSWKHWFSTKNEVKAKRWRKCKCEDVPNFFLSVCHCFRAKAASVPPSPQVLFCSTNNWGTRRRKYLLCPVWESMRINQWHSFFPPINLFHPFLHPQNTFLSWFPNDLKYSVYQKTFIKLIGVSIKKKKTYICQSDHLFD